MQKIADGIVNNILVTLVISLMISIERQLPSHSRKARVIKKLNESLKDFGALDSLDIPIGIACSIASMWNELLLKLQVLIEEYDDDGTKEVQLELFQ